MDMVHPLATAYAEDFTSGENGLLAEIAAFTHAHHAHSNLMSNRLQGKFLELISCLMQPHRILEIGSFVGYSSLYLCKGLVPEGFLHCIELREADAAIARENFQKAGMQDKIILHQGNAIDIIPSINETWDLVFIDADKTGYCNYYKLVLPKLRKGGLIIADNVLFHGGVLQEKIKGKNAIAIQAFNELVKNDPSVEKVMLTVRDGLFLIRKK